MHVDMALTVEIVNFALAVIAIIFAVVAIRYALKQARDATKTLDSINTALSMLGATRTAIDNAVGMLSTRYIGAFPANLEELTALLAGAKQEIIILSDFAGYGSYSAKGSYLRYRDAIVNAINRASPVRVTFYVYDGNICETVLRREFSVSHPFQPSASDRSKALLSDFVAKMKTGYRYDVYDLESFIHGLLIDEQSCLQDFARNGASYHNVAEGFPYFVWMVDGEECIFSFENEPEKQYYFAFKTRDGRLVDYFKTYISAVARRCGG